MLRIEQQIYFEKASSLIQYLKNYKLSLRGDPERSRRIADAICVRGKNKAHRTDRFVNFTMNMWELLAMTLKSIFEILEKISERTCEINDASQALLDKTNRK